MLSFFETVSVTRLRGLAAGLWLSAGLLVGQDSMRCWGTFHFDTRALDQPCTQVSAAAYDTLVLTADGRPFLFGQNSLRVGEVPTAPPGTRYVDVAIHADSLHADFGVGLLSDGTVIGWGEQYGGLFPSVPPLPAGLRYVRMSPCGLVLERSDGAFIVWRGPPMPPLPAGTTVVAADSNGFGCFGAVLSDGSLLMWGDNSYGQLNVPPLPPGTLYTGVAFGYFHTLAVRSDGTIVSFGTGPAQLLTVPVLPPGTSYLMCSAGWGFSVAYRSDNVLVAWGDNYDGQLNVPVLPPGVTCEELDSGQAHSVARLSDGRILTWGLEFNFQAGVPAMPGAFGNPATRRAHVSVGLYNGIVIYKDGTIDAFGAPSQVTVPVPPPGVGFVRSEVEATHSVALRTDGQLVAWGDGSVGQGAIPPLPPGLTYVDFAVGEGHTVAIRSDGQAFAFGDNSFGQLNIPALPTGLAYVDVDAVYGRTLLVRSDGQIVAVGAPYFGAVPAPALPAGLRYVSIAAGEFDNAALRSDGFVVQWPAWPGPTYGYVPIPALPIGVSYVEVAGGRQVVALRRSDGKVVVAGLVTPPYYDFLAAIPPLDPGTSYVQLFVTRHNIAARVGPTSTYVSFAPGCAGSRPATRLVPRDTPRIGRTHRVTLFDLPVDVAVLAMGFQRMPTGLAALGMPGCSWHVSLDATMVIVGQGNEAVWELPIPDVPSLVGLQFLNQAFVLDPAAGNPMGAVVSDAATGVIGYP